MNSEIPAISSKTRDTAEVLQHRAGWLLYDGDCPFCSRSARRVERLVAARGFQILPLQTPWVRHRLGLAEDTPPREMIVLTSDGRTFGGADAVLFLAARFWWTWPLRALASLPGVQPLLRHAYAAFAARRSCAGGACAMRKSREASHAGPPLHAFNWIPLVAIPLATTPAVRLLPAWAFMWMLAFAVFAGCKWLTWRDALRHGVQTTARRSLGYLLAWPGMDATTFLTSPGNDNVRAARREPDPPIPRPRAREWWLATAKTLLGAALIWLGVRFVSPDRPLLAGWTGMIGLIFVLHFGSFHLLSLAWRIAGVNAPPLMRAPLLAQSLADFWGRRWNAAFNDLVHRFTFRPLARRWSATAATLGVFTLSGLVHDVVISIPAHGGYGLPTLYFLVQGLGLLIERRTRIRRSAFARIFALAVVVLPAPVLFHPPFVHGVILPFLRTIGAY